VLHLDRCILLQQNNNPVGTAAETITVKVSGMLCASCARRVENALRGQKGISGVSVDLRAGKAKVDYDPALTGPEDVKRMIEAAGYDVA
jgi:copper chaperone CopZ